MADIQFRDLRQQYQKLKPQMDKAVLEVMEQAQYISGPQVVALEQRLAAYVGRKHCISCANGTDALVLLMRAYNIGPGDALFVPDFTFFATAECASNVGAVPIFVDVCEDTFNMDAGKLDQAISAVKKAGKLRPRAVMAVDLFGLQADYTAIGQVAEKHGLLLFEDAAQGFGGTLAGKPAGAFGTAATTSFFPAKPLGCYGDGGAVFVDDDEKAALIRSLCVHGKGTDKYDNVRIGYNSRLDTLQAAVLQVKLDAFEQAELAAVNRVAAEYTRRLAGAVHVPVISEGMTSSWAQYTIRLESEQQRDSLMVALKQAGIPSMVYYPKPLREQGAFAEIAEYQVDTCPVAKKLTQTVLALPMHPYLTNEEIGRVCEVISSNPL